MSKKSNTKRRQAPAVHSRTRFLGGAAVVAALAGVIGAAWRFRHFDGITGRARDGHAAPDLAADAPRPGTERAPEAFRPDPTASVPAADREALRPATGSAPSLIANRGEMRSQTAPGVATEGP